MNTKTHFFRLTKTRIIILLTTLVSLLAISAFLYYSYESNSMRTQKYEELKIIADSKQNQIVTWCNARLNDATMATESPLFNEALTRYLNQPSSELLRNNMHRRLKLLQKTYSYDEIYITNEEAIPSVFLSDEQPTVDSSLRERIKEAIQQRRNILTDFYRIKNNNKIKIDVIAPVFKADSTPLGVLILRIDPNKYLYPLIQSWPTPSKTAETVIVRRESNGILFLNELRHKKNTALSEYIPLSSIDVPAVKAVLGVTGITSGVDYRNVPVIADIRPITGTPWFMVTKVDQEEILSELHFRATILIIIVLMASLLITFFIAWLYHFRQQNIYKKLLNAENEFRTTLYSIGDAVITVSKEGIIRHMNQIAEHLTGYVEIDAKGKTIELVVHIQFENSHKRFIPFSENRFNSEQSREFGEKMVIQSRNGNRVPISISIAPIVNEGGIHQGAILVLHDQTKERKAEKELLESRERLAFALDGANDGLWDVQMKTGSVYLSPRACEILGYTQENIHNTVKVWTDLIYPPDLPAMQVALDNYFAANAGYFSLEQRLRTKQGELKWILTRGKVVSNNDLTGPTRMVGTYTDITKKKESEQEILHLNESLEHKVIERTQQLEAANKDLESFSYSVSHDLRAPLRHIDGFVSILLNDFQEDLPQEAKRYLNTIIASAKQMGTLIDDLLKFSRTGRLEMNKKTFSMDRVVANAINQVMQIQATHPIEWIINPLPEAFGDENLLQLAWVNLVENAVKYSWNCSNPKIEIGTITKQSETIFYIRDNGVGFDMQYAQKLFGVFQRMHSEAEFEGTGIGLANVHRIITRHGGKIWAEAEPNKGATFSFLLPKFIEHQAE